MSYQKNGYIYDCDDDCDNCSRADFCEDYFPTKDKVSEENSKEQKQEDIKQTKNEKKEKYYQPNFLDL